jgi:hypothetical protein
MLIDAMRLTDRSLVGTVSNIVGYFRSGAGGWNHQRAAKFMRYGFDRAGSLEHLVGGCRGDGRKAFADNTKIVEATLPAILDRKAQSFPFPRTKLALTPDLHSGIGPAFFIVEDGLVRLVYLHARNDNRASLADLAAFASLAKREILDNDFYGIAGDIEIHLVDKRGANRLDTVLSFAELEPHLREPAEATVARFVEAFLLVDRNRLAGSLRPRKERELREDGQQEFPF